jgi:hypothetical protein
LRVPYLVQRDNQYYFQIRLPADVQHNFQCTQFKKSLRTTDKRQAATKIKILSVEFERVIFMIRSGLLTPQMILTIVTEYKEGLLGLHRKYGRKSGVDNSDRFREVSGTLQ